MKVHELVEQLQQCPQDADVLLQIDPEGNGYRTVEGADPGAVVINDENIGNQLDSFDVVDVRWSAEDACMTEQEWQETLQMPRTVVIFP